MYTIKKIFFYLAVVLIVAVSASSCSPVVRTAVVKSYPAVAQEQVTVYWDRSEVPENSEELGAIVVTDGGFTTQCDSLTVINLVKQESGKMGGNAALITEHKRPSIWTSTCHRMWATALKTNGLQLPKSDTSTPTTILPKPPRAHSRVRFVANLGYGFRTAKISPDLTPDERKDLEQRMSGLVWEAQVTYFFQDYMGIGLDYCGYYATSSYPTYLTDMPSVSGILNTSDIMTYIGPALIVRTPFKKWVFDYSFGMGYFDYTSKGTLNDFTASSNGSTLGVKYGVGASYKLDEQLEIGASLQLLGGLLSKYSVTDFYGMTKTVTRDLEQREGLGQFRLMVGLRYNIK